MQTNQEHIKKIIHHDQVDFITIMLRMVQHMQIHDRKKSQITSIDLEKVLTKINIPL